MDDEATMVRDALAELERSAGRFGSAITDALKGATVEGRAFEDVLRSLGRRLADMALDSALKPLEGAASGVFGGLANALTGAVGGALTGGTAFTPQPALAPVTVNVSTPDAASFQRSSGQISALVARSTARGRRSL